MAKKKIANAPLQYGVERMNAYAKDHGFNVVEGSYQVVKKHQKKTSMKDIDAYGHQRQTGSSRSEELCEILKVSTVRRDGKVIEGYLVGYASGIRFDANEKY